MDHARTKPKSAFNKRIVLTAAGAFVLLAGGFAVASIDFSTQRVERRKITIDAVKRGPLEIKVHANGQLLPRNVEYLAAQVNGRVARTYVKAGAEVQAGTLLAELGNPQLVASAEEAKSAWEGAVNEARAAQAELRANLLNQEARLTQAKFEQEKAKARLDAENKLIGRGIVSEIDYENSKLNAAQTAEAYQLEQHRFAAIRDNIQVQLDVRKARAQELEQAYGRAKDQVANLRIVAGIDGVVQEMAIDVGQQLQPGAPIGRVAQPDRLYAELRVPAREATEVQNGQKVVIDTRNGLVDGAVTRVDPAVTDGTVIVDVDLSGALPTGARPQLPVEGTVYLSQLPDTLFVSRPAYVKSNAAISVFKLDADGRYATRVPIKAGKVSLDYLQVTGGLDAGDRIITSETGEWQSKDRILLN